MTTLRYKFPYSDSELAKEVNRILDEYDTPLTLRQVYYRLVSIGLENSQNVYKNLSGKLSRLREQGFVPWDRIADLNRVPKKLPSWISPEEFFDDVGRSYRRNRQQEQPNYVEIWCEKAVAIQQIAERYDINLLAGGGYRSSTALFEASERFKEIGKPVVILYLGDFDPSGLDIERDIQTRMKEVFGITVDVQRVLLNRLDIDTFNLLPSPVKLADKRTPEYIRKWKISNAYELDALPPDVLAGMLEKAIRRNMDLSTYEDQKKTEFEDNEKVKKFIEAWNNR